MGKGIKIGLGVLAYAGAYYFWKQPEKEGKPNILGVYEIKDKGLAIILAVVGAVLIYKGTKK